MTLTATLTPAGTAGKVTFYDGVAVLGTASISNGTATLTTAGLGAGSHALYARYVAGAGEASEASSQISERVMAKPGGGFAPFLPASASDTTAQFNGVFSGDLNHDGYPDLITTNTYDAISVFVNQGNGTFTGPTNYLTASRCYNVAIADMNLDGNPDLVVSTNEGVALLRGNGDGTFGSPITVESAADVTWVAVADVNSDGIPDIIVAHGTDSDDPSRIEVLPGNGDGSFQTGVSTRLAYSVGSMALGDFNGDGTPDLAVGSSFGVGILLGVGDGTFQAPVNYTLNSVASIVSGDLNGDGITDLAVGGGALITVLLGNGDGGFRTLPPINVDPVFGGGGGGCVCSLAITDINGDGKMDLLAAYEELMMLPGNGDGTFQPPFPIPPIGGSGWDAKSMSVADFNHDGVADVAMGPSYLDIDWVYLGELAPILSLTASPNPASEGQRVTLTVTSSFADATGTVQFQEINGTGTDLGTVALSGGTATLQMTNPGPGTYAVFATYSGDSKYVETKSPEVDILSTQPGPAITLTASPNPALVGQQITLTATVAYTPGNPQVAFFDGTTPLDTQTLYPNPVTLSLNPATFKTTLAAGTHQLRAVFPEYSGYLPTSASYTETVQAAPGGQLTAGTGFNAGGMPVAMITADVNQDGLADIVFADTNPNQIGVLIGNGNGTFDGPYRTSLGFAPGALVATQLDIYGWTDLAVTNPAGNSVELLQYDLGDSYFPPYESLAVGANPVSIAAADFNGDGYPDLITANSGSNNVSILLTLPTSGPGAFGTTVNLGTGTQPVAVATADFNNDGNADFVVADYGSSDLRVFLGNGDGTFRSPSTIAVASGPVAVAVGDFNGDGKADLAVLSAGAGQLSILLGQGDGAFSSAATYSVGAGATAIAIAGLNADGKLDIAVSTAAGVLVFYGNGDGSFQTPSTYSPIAGAMALVAGDFGGAGRMDLAALSASANAVLLSLNLVPTTTTLNVTRSAATVNARVTMTATVTPAVTGGSVTFYDGVQILASAPVVSGQGSAFVTSLAGGSHTIHARFTGSAGYGASLSQGVSFTSTPVSSSGPLGPATQVLPAFPANLAASDFNSDGIVDFAMWAGGNGLYALLGQSEGGQGDGVFTEVSSIPQAFGGSSLIACDFNGDGKPDVAYIFDSNSSAIALGNGDGTFHQGGLLQTDSVNAIAAADVNRDGRPDLIFTDSSGFLQVLLGNGNGTLQIIPASYPAGANPAALAVGDLNNDGVADVVVTNSGSSGPNTISVLLGKADGTFGAPHPFATDLNPQALAIADFNGDGNLDVAVVHATQPTVAILLGNGDGTFKPAALIPVGAAPTQIFAADMNGDGVPDLVLFYERSTAAFSILYGNGDGTFQPPATFQGSHTAYAMAIADVNGDGLPDVVVGWADSSQGIDVYLGSSACPTSISPDVSLASSAQQLTISVAASAACQWTARTTAGFVTIASGANGTGSGSVVIDVAANGTGAARTARIAIGSLTFTLTQAQSLETTPALVISSLSPGAEAPGGTDFALTVNGSGFVSGAAVMWNGSALSTGFAGPTQLTALVPASLYASVGEAVITVVNPGGATSNGFAFPIQPPR